MKYHSRIGYIYVIFGALLWAISGTASKYLFKSGITAFELVQIRLTLSALYLFLWLKVKKPQFLRIKKEHITEFIILGTVGMAFVQFTYLYSISKINVAAAILLQYLAPVFIALYTALVLREKPPPVVVAAIICAVTGCYLVVGGYNFDLLKMNRAGVAAGLASAVAFSIYSVRGESAMTRYSPYTVLFYAILFGSIAWNILFPPLSAFRREFNATELLWINYIAVFGTVIPFGLYYKGISLLGSARSCITATLEPIIAAFVSFMFLGESMELLQISGGGLVILAIVVLQLRDDGHEQPDDLINEQYDGV